MSKLKVAMRQINPTVGNLERDKYKIIRFVSEARDNNADIIVFPELAITRHSPKDFFFKKKFFRRE